MGDALEQADVSSQPLRPWAAPWHVAGRLRALPTMPRLPRLGDWWQTGCSCDHQNRLSHRIGGDAFSTGPCDEAAGVSSPSRPIFGVAAIHTSGRRRGDHSRTRKSIALRDGMPRHHLVDSQFPLSHLAPCFEMVTARINDARQQLGGWCHAALMSTGTAGISVIQIGDRVIEIADRRHGRGAKRLVSRSRAELDQLSQLYERQVARPLKDIAYCSQASPEATRT